MRSTNLAKKTISKSKVYGEKEKAFCDLVVKGVEPALAWKQVSGTKASEEAVAAMAKRLMNRGDIRLEIELKRKAIEDEALESQRLREERERKPLMPEIVETGTSGDIEWSQSIAFNRLKRLLDGCDSAAQLLEDRPRLFKDIRDLISDVRAMLATNGVTVNNTSGVQELSHILENIESIVSKVSKFSIKEYNSTILTASNLMKEINSITGVKKNAGALKNETFEDKLMRLIEESGTGGYNNTNILSSNNNIIKESGGRDLMREMEAYAYDDKDD